MTMAIFFVPFLLLARIRAPLPSIIHFFLSRIASSVESSASIHTISVLTILHLPNLPAVAHE